MNRVFRLTIVINFVLFSTKFLALSVDDSLKTVKPAKHYFKTIIYTDFYKAGKRDLDLKDFYSKRLQSYELSQFSLGFNIPLLTRDYYNKDSTVISNFHLLLTGQLVSLRPVFDGLSTNHKLIKTTIGLRGIYNNGKRSLFYGEIAPFSTRDRGFNYTRVRRFSTMFLYNFIVNKNFTLRLGYVRSFAFGSRYHLPFVGIRVGRLDGVNLSIQFPRNITINVPIGNYFRASAFTKPQGGLYTMANTDSIYYLYNDKRLYFGRFEFLSGLRLDVFPLKQFSFYLSGGITTNNQIALFSDSYNKKAGNIYKPFYKEKIQNALFVNFGLAIKFGKVKSIYNNYNLYDAQDLNNQNSEGINQGNSQIPSQRKKIKNINLKDIDDLLEVQDFY